MTGGLQQQATGFQCLPMLRFVFLLLVLPHAMHAQIKHDYVWLFGPEGPYGTMLDFGNPGTDQNPVDLPFYLGMESAMISNKDGYLKYYTSGCSIADVSNEILPGADSLNPGYYYENYCSFGGNYVSGNQSMVWLPRDSKYQLVYKHEDIYFNPNNTVTYITDALLFTEIYNNVVTVVNKPILTDTLSFATLAMVPGTSDHRSWVVTPLDSSDIYYIVGITENTTFDIAKQKYPEIIRRNHNGDVAKFSPDGSMYIGYESAYLDQSLKVFSFDRESGNLEYLFSLPHPEETTSLVGGIEFSPSGRFLYVSTWSTIYQYDMEASDIETSKTVVAEYDGFVDLFPSTFHVMQRGPDCRIYINSPNSNKYLHVMMHPDVKGPDCEVRQHEIKLYYNHQISMPYFPNYRLGTGEPVCDSTLSLPTSIPVVSLPEEGLRIWPNPASGDCRVMLAPGVLRMAVTLDVVDLWGRSVLTRDLTTNYEEVIPIDVSLLIPGVYFIRVIGRHGERWVERLVVE